VLTVWLLLPLSVVVDDAAELAVDELSVVVVSSLPLPPAGFCSVLEDSFDTLDSVVVELVRDELLLVVT